MGWFGLKFRSKQADVGGRQLCIAGAGVTIDASASPVRYRGESDWSQYMDEVPQWRIAQEAWANAIGIVLPDYRTRSEFEDARAKCEAALALCSKLASGPSPNGTSTFDRTPPANIEPAPKPREIAKAVPVPVSPRVPVEPVAPCPVYDVPPPGPEPVTGHVLAAHDAAVRFLADLRAMGEEGPLDDAQMSDLYLAHCARNDLIPTPENLMRDALKTLPGVWKKQHKTRQNGKRVRKWLWLIAVVEPVKLKVAV